MFKHREQSPMASSGQETIIAQGVKVEGDFTSSGDVLIDGEVAGTVRTASNLRVGETSRITADVTAASAVVAGEIQGNVHIADRLELMDTSVIHGDVECGTLTVAAGATINGRITMGGSKE